MAETDLDKLETVILDEPTKFSMELGLVRASCCWPANSEDHAIAMNEIRQTLIGVHLTHLGQVWDAAESLAGEGIDQILLQDELDKRGITELPAPPDSTERLIVADFFRTQEAPKPDNARAYAKRLRERHNQDQDALISDQASQVLKKGNRQGLTEAGQILLDHLHVGSGSAEVQPLAKDLPAIEEQLEQRHGKQYIGLIQKTIGKLDEYTLGLRGFMLLAAMPGTGKTNLGIQLGADIVRHNSDALFVFFSFEMSKSEITQRIISREANIPWRNLVLGDIEGSSNLQAGNLLRFTEKNRDAYNRAKTSLNKLGQRIVIMDISQLASVSFPQMRATIEHWKARTKTKRAFILFDYMQTIPVPQAILELDEISRHKYTIGELLKLQHASQDDAILVISEQSKATMGTEEMKSVYGTVRGIYSPDIVFTLKTSKNDYNPDTKNPDTVAVQADLSIVKGRDGVTRSYIPLDFYYQINSFSQADRSDRLGDDT